MSRYIQKTSYDVTELDGDVLILDTQQFTVTKLNQVGGFCWELLEDEQSLETLRDAVFQQFSLEEEKKAEIEADLKVFLSDLERCQLIRHVSD